MPEKNIAFMPEKKFLTDKEIYSITKAVSQIGISKVRITGGEPLVREGIVSLIKDIKALSDIKEVCITTNGILLQKHLDLLIDAGLDGVNISLDTFKKDLYKKITALGDLETVLRSIDSCIKKGLKVKLNTVIIEDYNESEIIDFVKYIEDKPVDVRFIELMPIGQGKSFKSIPTEKVKNIILKDRNLIPYHNKKNQEGPAVYFKTEKSLGKIGFISAMSNCFCDDCNRIRLTAEGFLKQCLHWNYGIDLKKVIRQGVSEEEFKKIIEDTIYNKPDKHNFNSKNNDDDNRLMYQIGG
jgi:cyclic pyranopterin phosphate synthase